MMLWRQIWDRQPSSTVFKLVFRKFASYRTYSLKAHTIERPPAFRTKAAALVRHTLHENGVFNTHLFDRPLRISLSDLDTLSMTFKAAASQSNVLDVIKVSKKVPQDEVQVRQLLETLDSARTVSFNIALQEHLEQTIKSLKTNINNSNLDNDLILSVIHTLFYTQWFTVNDIDVKSTTLAAVKAFDNALTSSLTQLPLSTWCRFMQWRLTVDPRASPLYSKFLRNSSSMCQTTKDIIALSALFGPISDRVEYGSWWKLESRFAKIASKNQGLWYDNEALMGVLCHGLSKIRNHQCLDVNLNVLLWDVIVHNMKHVKETELSTALKICIIRAASSLHSKTLKEHPFLLEKILSSIEAINLKLARISPITGMYVFQCMIRSKHVHEPVAMEFLRKSVNIKWQAHQVFWLATTIRAMTDYGCTDDSIYRPILRLILSEELSSLLNKKPAELLLILQGLSRIHVFPHRLLAMLFGKIQEQGSTHPLIVTKRRMQQLLRLNGTLPIMCPSYEGPRLDEQTKKLVHEASVPKLTASNQYNDGFSNLLSKMVMLTRAAIESFPTVTHRYIVQVKPALEHISLREDIVLITANPADRNVVIVFFIEDDFLKLYNESREVSLKLIAICRSKLAQLRKLGYIVVTIKFDEHLKSENHSQLVKDKLEAAGVF